MITVKCYHYFHPSALVDGMKEFVYKFIGLLISRLPYTIHGKQPTPLFSAIQYLVAEACSTACADACGFLALLAVSYIL